MCYLCTAVNQTQSNHIAQVVTGGGQYQVIQNSGISNIDNMIIGSQTGNNGQAATIKYTFDNPKDGETDANNNGVPDQPYPFMGNTIGVLNAAAKQVTVDWLQKIANVCNLTFVDTGTAGTHDFTIGITNLSTGSGVKGYVTFPWYGHDGQHTLSLRALVIDDDSPNLTRDPNNVMYSAMGHELGHAMGIDHTFANGNPGNPTVTPAFNNVDWSIMSYSDGPVTGNRVVDTMMYGDIQVLQYLYGANTSYHSGNDDYIFDSNNLIPFTIWDGGGNDTVRATNATAGVTLDIRDDYGNLTTDRDNAIPISGGTVKFWVYKNANIENAIGGGFNDNITGNALGNYLFGGSGSDLILGGAGADAIIGGENYNNPNETNGGNDTLSGGADGDIIFGNGGNDVLYGGAVASSDTSGTGNDTLFGGLGNDLIYGHDGDDLIIGGAGQDSLYGGAGNDTYVMGWYNQVDIIYQFGMGGAAGDDILRVFTNVNNSGIQTAADVIARMTTDGNHTWIDLSGGNAVLIAWKVPSQFTAGDIVIANTVS